MVSVVVPTAQSDAPNGLRDGLRKSVVGFRTAFTLEASLFIIISY
jgi:hypothetical protein